MDKINIKPSKPVSAGTLIVLIFMLLFGVAFAFLVGGELYEKDEPALKFLFSLFMLAWIGGVLFMIVYHVLNIKRAKGLSLVDIETETSLQRGEMKRDPIQRLRDLEALKRDGLISEGEFQRKRAEIMEEKW